MKRTPVDSSSIASIGYDRRTHTLEVEFRGGRVYQYLHVPPGTFLQFMRADSKGRFINYHVKGVYPYAPL